MNINKTVQHLIRAEDAIAERNRKLAALEAEQGRARDENDNAKERLAVALLRERGVFGLPTTQLAALLSNLEVRGVAVHGAIIASARPVQIEANDGKELLGASETVGVRVQISRNTAEAKRDLLIEAGLRWNGKAGRWIGRVDRRSLDELKAGFADRLEIDPETEEVGWALSATPVRERSAVTPALVDPSEGQLEDSEAEADANISGDGADEANQNNPPALASGRPGSIMAQEH